MATIRSKNYVKEQDLSKSELKKSCSWVASVTKRKKKNNISDLRLEIFVNYCVQETYQNISCLCGLSYIRLPI